MQRLADKNKEKELKEYYRYLLTKGYSYEELFNPSYQKISISEEFANNLKKNDGVANINIDFISIFSEYMGQEQFIRKNFFKDRKCMEKYMFKIDSLNHTRLKEFIDINGFPNETELGKYKYIPLLLITHIITNESTKDSWYGYYRPILMKQAEKGEVSYSFITALDDRFHDAYDNYQLYGRWYMSNMSRRGMSVEERQKLLKNLTSPIKDIENLDKRRKEMGLPPFYIEAKYRNIILPEGYKPQK